MSALPPSQTRIMRETAHAERNRQWPGWREVAAKDSASGLAERWEQVHEAAARLAHLAYLSPERPSSEIASFAVAWERAGAAQRELALQGIEDIEAMMKPGLAALETIIARGSAPTAAALALWREFHGAREALLALVRGADRLAAA